MSNIEDAVENNEAYVNLWKRANDKNFDKFTTNLFKNSGDNDDAQEMAEGSIVSYYKRALLTKITNNDPDK